MRFKALVKETRASIRARPAYSIVFFAVASLAMLAVVLQFVYAQNRNRDIAFMMESAEYRTVKITDNSDTPLLSLESVRRMESVNVVESAWSFSAAFDVVNPSVPESVRVSAVYFYPSFGDLPIQVVHGRMPERPGEVIVPWKDYQRLGFDASGGTIEADSGAVWGVVGAFVPEHSRAPTSALIYALDDLNQVKTCILQVRSTQDIDFVVKMLATFVGVGHDDSITVDKSDDIKKLGGVLTSSQNSYTSVSILGTIALSLLVLAFLAVLMVNSRRVEFGRRRALGASRRTIIALLTLQSVLTVGTACLSSGIIGVVIALVFFPRGVPSVLFLASVTIIMIAGALIVQMPSVLFAALRDPVRVLRTP